MALGTARDPVEHEVRRGHEHDAAGVGIEGVFAGPSGQLQNAPLALCDTLAVAETLARDVLPARP